MPCVWQQLTKKYWHWSDWRPAALASPEATWGATHYIIEVGVEWGWGVSASGVGGPDQWEMGCRREPADQFLLPSLDDLYRDAESSMPHLKTSLETKPSATVIAKLQPTQYFVFIFPCPCFPETVSLLSQVSARELLFQIVF